MLRMKKKTAEITDPYFKAKSHHDPDAEIAVIACLYLDCCASVDKGRQTFAVLSRQVKPDMFYDARLRRAFAAGMAIMERGQFDPVEWLREMRDEDMWTYLAVVKDYIATSAHLLSYIKALRKAAYIRETAIKIETLLQRLNDGDYDSLESLLGEMADVNFSMLRKLRYISNIYTYEELIEPFTNEIQTRITANRSNAFTGVPTGIKVLDDVLYGLKPGKMVVVGGQRSEGKSDLCVNIALNAARANFGVGLISIEMPALDVMTRLQSLHTNIFRGDISKGILSDIEFKTLKDHLVKSKTLPLIISDLPLIRLSDVRAITQEAIHRVDAKLMILDYLGLVTIKQAETREREVSMISAGLKQIAREFNISMVVASQLSRLAARRSPPIPELSDLRDSGSIEQDADIALLVSHQFNSDGSEVKGIMRINIAKNRDGQTIIIEDIPYDRATGQIGNMAARNPAPVRYEYQADASQDDDIPPF